MRPAARGTRMPAIMERFGSQDEFWDEVEAAGRGDD
jgi:hypothetical protein